MTEQRLSLRYSEHTARAIEELKRITGEQTTNKAILRAINHYPLVYADRQSLRAELTKVKARLDMYDQCIADWSQATDQLRRLIDEPKELPDQTDSARLIQTQAIDRLRRLLDEPKELPDQTDSG